MKFLFFIFTLAIVGCCKHLDHRIGLFRGGQELDDHLAFFESNNFSWAMNRCQDYKKILQSNYGDNGEFCLEFK